MSQQQSCSLCGQAVQFATLPDGTKVKLDTVPVFDGPYRLVGEKQESAERITRPGFYGYTDHENTCPAKTIH